MRTQLNKLEGAFGGAVQVRNFGRSERFVADAEFSRILEVAAWLRMEESFRMDFLEAFTVYESKAKFTLSYFIRSHSQSLQMVLRTAVPVPDAQTLAKVPSIVGVWPQAEPFETELSALFGMEFAGAPAPGGVRKVFGRFDGYPLRKAFEWREEIAP